MLQQQTDQIVQQGNEQLADEINSSEFKNALNNIVTGTNKSSVALTDIAATIKNSKSLKIGDYFSDVFMPTTAVASKATKLLEGPLNLAGHIGGAAGIIGTVITPIMEYDNSLEPYKDDIEAVYEIDPENAVKYDIAMHVAAGLDACSFGYVRGIANTAPAVYELAFGQTEQTQGWIKWTNEHVNSRSIVEKVDDELKDPVIGPKIKQFIR